MSDENEKDLKAQKKELSTVIGKAIVSGLIDPETAATILNPTNSPIAAGFRQGTSYRQKSGDFSQGKGDHTQSGPGGYKAGMIMQDPLIRKGPLTIDDIDIDVARELGLLKRYE